MLIALVLAAHFCPSSCPGSHNTHDVSLRSGVPERQAGDVGQVHAARHPEVVQGGDVRGDAGGHQGPGVPFNSLTLDAIKGTNLVRLWAKFSTRAGKNVY